MAMESPLFIRKLFAHSKLIKLTFKLTFFSGISSHIPTSPHLVEEQLETLTCVQPQTDFLLRELGGATTR
jgi:hypothetical protein